MAPNPMPGESLDTEKSNLEPIFYYKKRLDPIGSYFQGIIVILLVFSLLNLLFITIF